MPSLNRNAWILFQIMVLVMVTRGPKSGQPTWPKTTSILNTHPISVHAKFEVDCMTTFSENGQEPPFSVVLWPLDCEKLAVAKNHINSEHSPNNGTHQVWIVLHEYFSDNGQKPQFSSHIVGTTGPKFKANQFWTFTQSVYTARLNWIASILFPIMVWNHHFQSFYGQQGQNLANVASNQFWTLTK